MSEPVSRQVIRTEVFIAWLRQLRDRRAQARIAGVLQRAARGHLGVHKSLGGGLHELKIDSGPGYRIYFTLEGKEIIYLLATGDKSTQSRDIARARTMLTTLSGELK